MTLTQTEYRLNASRYGITLVGEYHEPSVRAAWDYTLANAQLILDQNIAKFSDTLTPEDITANFKKTNETQPHNLVMPELEVERTNINYYEPSKLDIFRTIRIHELMKDFNPGWQVTQLVYLYGKFDITLNNLHCILQEMTWEDRWLTFKSVERTKRYVITEKGMNVYQDLMEKYNTSIETEISHEHKVKYWQRQNSLFGR